MDAVTDCIPMNEGIVARIFLHTLFDFRSSVSQIIAERIQQMAASPNFAFKKNKICNQNIFWQIAHIGQWQS